MLQYDRRIAISSASSRWSKNWPAQTMFWSELVEKLKTPVRGTETLTEYLKLPKAKQDDLKDVGGFVGGTLIGGRRKASTVASRDIITLDLDNIPAGGTADVLRRLDGLGCAYVTYSTRKHEEAKPRLRVLIPTDRSVLADEYEPIARKMAEIIGINFVDPTTFEASRLMYWPSCCSDSQYVFRFGDKPFLSADGILAMYRDWRNVAEWPEVPGQQQKTNKLAAKQGDPLDKTGVVGAFCKVYDIYRAIETFLPGVYEPVAGSSDRLTYTGGSTVGGAIIYDGGKFLYSHHATDPAGGRLVNSFDLVRLHLFGDKDDEAKPGTPTNRLPSYAAMCEFAVQDEQVTLLLNQERYEKATQEFANNPDDDANWMRKLKLNSNTGIPLKNTYNVKVVLAHDPLLKGRIKKDTFAERIVGIAPLPWEPRIKEEGEFLWGNIDDSGLREYIEGILGFRSREIIEDALNNHAAANSFNPVVDYITSTEWDGTPRLDRLYIDYLGAEDCPYVRAVTRKAFVAAVARAMNPGTKFDVMTVICGPQGIGKTTLFEKMGGKWFTNSLQTFEGKDAAELLQGVWIVEVGELEAYSKTDIKIVRQFLSRREDHFRAAYARKAEKYPRRCVFFGTTNDSDYLKDTTGNRRFWPVDAWIQKPTKNVHVDLTPDEITQIWAEAVMYWRLGESLTLPEDLEAEANKRRDAHMDRDPLQGQIEEFLEKPIPEDWKDWNLERRRMFWAGSLAGNNIKLVLRNYVCALEIWRECLNENKNMTKADAHRINSILESIPGWKRADLIRFGKIYGSQRGFKRDLGVNIPGLKVLTNYSSCKHSQNMDVNIVNDDVTKNQVEC